MNEDELGLLDLKEDIELERRLEQQRQLEQQKRQEKRQVKEGTKRNKTKKAPKVRESKFAFVGDSDDEDLSIANYDSESKGSLDLLDDSVQSPRYSNNDQNKMDEESIEPENTLKAEIAKQKKENEMRSKLEK